MIQHGCWAVLGCDSEGVTEEARGPDPEVLANAWAAAAQQEEDKWPELGLVYMLVPVTELRTAAGQ